MNDPYMLPSGALRNRLGLEDPLLLAQAEADITQATLTRLAARPLPGDYDLIHLQRFHQEIFGLVYAWAGKIRTVDIAKQTPFCPARNLHSYAAEIFGRLRSADGLRGLKRTDFVRAAAYLYGDLNALHPFREGNGRTQRAFLGQLSIDAGWTLDWSGMSADENREASVKSFLGDNAPLERMLDRLILPESGSGERP